MKYFTLFAAAAICASTAMAQAPRAPRFFKPKAQQSAAMKARAAEQKGVLRPQSEEAFIYIENEWLPMSETEFHYDLPGNVLQEVSNEDDVLTRITRTYDVRGNVTSVITERDESGTGEEYQNEQKIEYKYDTKVKNFCIEKMAYQWDAVEGKWILGGDMYKKVIERDGSERITMITNKMWYDGEWVDHSRRSFSYEQGNPTGFPVLASEQNVEVLDWEEGTLGWGKPTTYNDLKWKSCNNQVVEDVNDLLIGANRIEHAMIIDEDYVPARVDVTYEDGKPDFEATYVAGSESKEVHTLTTTDANGSYKESFYGWEDMDGNGSFDDEERYEMYMLNKVDDHGNLTLEEEHEVMDDDDNIVGGMNFEYEYDANGCCLQMLIREFTIDEDSDPDFPTGVYLPFMKIVYGEYVSTGVHAVKPSAQGEAKAVYSLGGKLLGTSLSDLPAGIYVVKQGSKVQKVVK